MNKSTLKTKLGTRLKALHQRIPENTDYFYDLCCDHGALGRAVLESHANSHVVFNDIHPDIMARLERLLTKLNAKNFSLAICPAEKIMLATNNKLCIMLAGVGAEQCITILQAYLAQPITQQSHFIVSPATKALQVREFLRTQKVNSLNDSTVSENQRTYEIIEFNLNRDKPKLISEFGVQWQENNSNHVRHLQKILHYYQAQLINQPESSIAQKAVNGYQEILKKIQSKA